MKFIEKVGFGSAPLLNIHQVPEYQDALRARVQNILNKESWQSLISIFYNEIAPGQILMDHRVIDFCIYTSGARWNVMRIGDAGIFCWAFCATDFRHKIMKAIQNYYEIPLTALDAINGLARLAENNFQFKTQKVRGVAALVSDHNGFRHAPHHPLFDKGLALLKTAIVLPYQTDARHLPSMFARPCPSRPRHGFVESSVVTCTKGANLKFQQAKLEDPEAEMLVMAHANGRYSALSVPNMLTLADGFSGCTFGGAMYSVSIPHSPIPSSASLLAAAGVTNTPYIEYVEHAGMMMPVQLRDGPAIVGVQQNYIPHDIPPDPVILTCSHDLITYEQQLSVADPKKSVVFGFGKPLTSHYGAHAISFGIPFITDQALYEQRGCGIKKNTSAIVPARYHQIAMRLKQLMKTPLANHARIYDTDSGYATRKLERSVVYALTVAHLCPVWPKYQSDLNAITASGLFHFIGSFAVALLGELRHLRFTTCDGKLVRITTLPAFNFSDTRDSTFGRAAQIPMYKLVKCLAAAEVDFMHSSWSASYGGGQWASAAMSLHTLVSRVYTFIERPNVDTWGALLRDWHTCINEQHNGGYVLNKFTSNKVFNTAAENPTNLILTYKKTYEYYMNEAGISKGYPSLFHKSAIEGEEEPS